MDLMADLMALIMDLHQVEDLQDHHQDLHQLDHSVEVE